LAWIRFAEVSSRLKNNNGDSWPSLLRKPAAPTAILYDLIPTAPQFCSYLENGFIGVTRLSTTKKKGRRYVLSVSILVYSLHLNFLSGILSSLKTFRLYVST